MISINVRYVVRLLALLLFLMSLSMLGALAWALYDYWVLPSAFQSSTDVIRAILTSIGIGGLVGGGLYWFGRQGSGHLGKREALLIVCLAWFVGTALAALPFWIWAQGHEFLPGQDRAFLSYINCYFEAMSGLTTTGATILNDIQTIPRPLLFWRAFTHWLGGLGIVVIFVAVLPLVGGGTKRLFRVESTGITSDGVTPNMKETARVLLLIYLGLTFAEILLLKLLDQSMSWFSAITHTFATLATGGYSIANASAGGLSPIAQWVILVFMVLAGVNFALYHQIMVGKVKEVYENSELRFYLIILGIGFLVILFSIVGSNYQDTLGQNVDKTWSQAIRDAAFQTVSIQTTTGFCTVNFEQWGLLAQAVLLALMFVGGCGGSTGGGIKVIRILGALKIMWVEMERAFRPGVLRPVCIGHHNVEFHQRISILAYVLGILTVFALGTFALFLTEDPSVIDGTTALTASIATVNNIGPGLGLVGPVDNYSWFSSAGKLILCFLMAIGRLEVFAVLVVFMPRFWRTY